MKVTVHIWDLPLRIFHWLLAFAVTAAYVTAKLGGAWMDWHGRLGVFILGLLIFRIVWGFIGSTHARFTSFFPTWSRMSAYVRGQWQGVGHNPLGALSVLALLAVVGVQVSTGLFANDDIAFEGPLKTLVDKSLSDQFTGWHSLIFNVLFGLIILHVLAIVFYRWVKKTNLVGPMLTGKKEIPTALAATVVQPHSRPYAALRFALSLVISSSIVWGVSDGIAQIYAAPVKAQAAPTYAGF